MAVYFLNLKTFGRSGGSSAVSAAAYRAGERIRDERTGRTYDHTDRQDVMHKEIVLPSHLVDADMSWAKERSQLWNAAESAESRRNARVAREYLVALPVELDAEQRLDLVRGFSQELADRYRFALDLAVHAPRDFPDSDPRNFHAHLLATTREVTAEGLVAKTTLELGDAKRRDLGLGPAINELFFVRERWATVTNEALRAAHIEARVDHRSLAAQGIEREPYPYIPRAAFEMERQGYRSVLAERMRMQYQARVQARMERSVGHDSPATVPRELATREPTAPHEPAVMREQTVMREAQAAKRPQTLEEIRRQAREDWLRLRQASAKASANEYVKDDHLKDDHLKDDHLKDDHLKDDQFSR
jgi:ATP-dependent exoDNAse (exonuclease V) alpha subunit